MFISSHYLIKLSNQVLPGQVASFKDQMLELTNYVQHSPLEYPNNPSVSQKLPALNRPHSALPFQQKPTTCSYFVLDQPGPYTSILFL